MRFDGKTQFADYITVLNGVAGFLAITFIIDRRFLETALLIMAALCLDGIDGFVARRVGGGGRGHYLDSFADTISFCLAPALMLYTMYYDPLRGRAWVDPQNALAVISPTLVAALGILRLARFVGRDHEEGNFRGLPTPANAILLTSAAILFGPGTGIALPGNGVIVLLFAIATSFLMISEVPYPKVADAFRGPLGIVMGVIGMAALVILFFAANPVTVAGFLFCIAMASALGYLIGGPIYAGKPRSSSKILRVQ